MKSVDRAIHKVKEKISQAGNESVTELQTNLKCVSSQMFWLLFFKCNVSLLEVVLFSLIWTE